MIERRIDRIEKKTPGIDIPTGLSYNDNNYLGSGVVGAVYGISNGTNEKPEYVIKVPNSLEKQTLVDEEYEVLNDLAENASNDIQRTFADSLPTPPAALVSVNGLKALVLPYYGTADLLMVQVRNKLETQSADEIVAAERLVLKGALALADAMNALRGRQRLARPYSCTDRKIKDFYFFNSGNQEKVVIIDWNVLNKDDLLDDEISLFAHLFHEMLLGHKGNQRFNPLNDEEWLAYGLNELQPMSLGLRYILALALEGNKFVKDYQELRKILWAWDKQLKRPLIEIEDELGILQRWIEKTTSDEKNAPDTKIEQDGEAQQIQAINPLSAHLALNSYEKFAILIDLYWRLDGFQSRDESLRSEAIKLAKDKVFAIKDRESLIDNIDLRMPSAALELIDQEIRRLDIHPQSSKSYWGDHLKRWRLIANGFKDWLYGRLRDEVVQPLRLLGTILHEYPNNDILEDDERIGKRGLMNLLSSSPNSNGLSTRTILDDLKERFSLGRGNRDIDQAMNILNAEINLRLAGARERLGKLEAEGKMQNRGIAEEARKVLEGVYSLDFLDDILNLGRIVAQERDYIEAEHYLEEKLSDFKIGEAAREDVIEAWKQLGKVDPTIASRKVAGIYREMQALYTKDLRVPYFVKYAEPHSNDTPLAMRVIWAVNYFCYYDINPSLTPRGIRTLYELRKIYEQRRSSRSKSIIDALDWTALWLAQVVLTKIKDELLKELQTNRLQINKLSADLQDLRIAATLLQDEAITSYLASLNEIDRNHQLNLDTLDDFHILDNFLSHDQRKLADAQNNWFMLIKTSPAILEQGLRDKYDENYLNSLKSHIAELATAQTEYLRERTAITENAQRLGVTMPSNLDEELEQWKSMSASLLEILNKHQNEVQNIFVEIDNERSKAVQHIQKHQTSALQSIQDETTKELTKFIEDVKAEAKSKSDDLQAKSQSLLEDFQKQVSTTIMLEKTLQDINLAEQPSLKLKLGSIDDVSDKVRRTQTQVTNLEQTVNTKTELIDSQVKDLEGSLQALASKEDLEALQNKLNDALSTKADGEQLETLEKRYQVLKTNQKDNVKNWGKFLTFLVNTDPSLPKLKDGADADAYLNLLMMAMMLSPAESLNEHLSAWEDKMNQLQKSFYQKYAEYFEEQIKVARAKVSKPS